jgi:hypothetical protein
MNVIERSTYRDEEGNIALMKRVNATLDFGFSWFDQMQAQLAVTQRLTKVLGDQHVLIRNASIPGIDESDPYMILISPQGIRLVKTHPVRGVFRAKEDDWLRFNSRSRHFVQTKPNLQAAALNQLRQVNRLLESQNIKVSVVEAVLIFTHARTLIDSARPATRVVSADAIEFFAANLEQLPRSLNSETIHRLVDAILYPQLPEPKSAGDLVQAPEIPKRLQAEAQPEHQSPFFKESLDDYEEEPLLDLQDSEFFKDFDLSSEEMPELMEETEQRPSPAVSKGQWLLLGIMAFLQVIILIIFAYLVLTDMGII